MSNAPVQKWTCEQLQLYLCCCCCLTMTISQTDKQMQLGSDCREMNMSHNILPCLCCIVAGFYKTNSLFFWRDGVGRGLQSWRKVKVLPSVVTGH